MHLFASGSPAGLTYGFMSKMKTTITTMREHILGALQEGEPSLYNIMRVISL